MKTYAISTSNENHYNDSYESALVEFEEAKKASIKIGVRDTIYLFELPEYPENFEGKEYLVYCLENNTAKELKKETV